jgi:Toxin co-regulated pilus biosynthesis protein Q
MIRGLVILVAMGVSCAYAQPRLQVIGDLGHQPVSPVQQRVEGNLVTVAKMIAPHGWIGYASKSINTTRRSTINVEQGEPWTAAFERWLAQEQLVARVDSSNRQFFLDPDPNARKAASVAPAQTQPESSPAPVAAAPAPVIAPMPTSQVAAPVAPAPAPVATQQMAAGQRWQVRIDDIKLENTLKRWAQQANYQLIWDTDREVLIPASDEFIGSFEDAIDRLLQSPAIRKSEHPLEAVIYSNNPPLVRITRLGDQ